MRCASSCAAAMESPDHAMAIELRGERVLLDPQRALIWSARRTVLIADPHFGKDDVFRRAGIALPPGTANADLARLTALVETHACERLVVLGDFVHGATRTGDGFLPAFAAWREAHPDLAVEVIAGNHDRRERSANWTASVEWHTTPVVDPPFVFSHEPRPDARGYVIAGHLHPVFHLARVRRRVRVPVFWQRADLLVMPSFGSFTGGASIRPAPTDSVFAVGPERVIALRRSTARPED
jgi:DNA ligase-associated metallophosphoesterase